MVYPDIRVPAVMVMEERVRFQMLRDIIRMELSVAEENDTRLQSLRMQLQDQLDELKAGRQPPLRQAEGTIGTIHQMISGNTVSCTALTQLLDDLDRLLEAVGRRDESVRFTTLS